MSVRFKKGDLGDECKKHRDCISGACDYTNKRCIVDKSEAIVLENKVNGRFFFKNFVSLVGGVSPIRMFEYKDGKLQGKYVRKYYVSNSITIEGINHIQNLQNKNFILCPVYEKVLKTDNKSNRLNKLKEFDEKDVKEIQLCVTGKVNYEDNDDCIKAINREMNEELGLKLDIDKDHTYINSEYKNKTNNRRIYSCDLLVNIEQTKKIREKDLLNVNKSKDQYNKKVSSVIYSETLKSMVNNLEDIDPEIFNNNDDAIIGFAILSVRDAKKFLGSLNTLAKKNITLIKKITYKVSS